MRLSHARSVPRLPAALSATLTRAVRVLDTFHVIKLGSAAAAAVDDVRRRVQQDTHGHRAEPGTRSTLYGTRRVLRRGAENLTDQAWDRLPTGLDAGDPWRRGSPPRTCDCSARTPDRTQAQEVLCRRILNTEPA